MDEQPWWMALVGLGVPEGFAGLGVSEGCAGLGDPDGLAGFGGAEETPDWLGPDSVVPASTLTESMLPQESQGADATDCTSIDAEAPEMPGTEPFDAAHAQCVAPGSGQIFGPFPQADGLAIVADTDGDGVADHATFMTEDGEAYQFAAQWTRLTQSHDAPTKSHPGAGQQGVQRTWWWVARE